MILKGIPNREYFLGDSVRNSKRIAAYRKLHGWKYQLMTEYMIKTNVHVCAITDFVSLGGDGWLTIKNGYAWDGATLAFDTITIIRGSLVHDALYQLIRLGELDKYYREQADKLLIKCCIQDGMWRIRALWIYAAVRLFGGGYAKP